MLKLLLASEHVFHANIYRPTLFGLQITHLLVVGELCANAHRLSHLTPIALVARALSGLSAKSLPNSSLAAS
ncbi:hypothetical protein HaLaN_17619 [Haematococcus lacustris]|uniref:Uncharacterized protein n=1 Tax=Haematococcus lacustris TaxID=44745 RepID=A0A699ZLM4_HAELA|nr:hypothetical protein HaLaN_17619 [Haematococcus lacustris]